MNEHTLSQRLERVARLVPDGARLADIGSDHAYLPVALTLRGRIDAAVAGEAVRRPYEAACRQVAKHELQGRIQVRLADGLDAIETQDGVTALTLCGMGGETIRDILARGLSRLRGDERLILQPNGGEPELRAWLMAQRYAIVHEEVLREHRFDYEIIVAERVEAVSYTPQELFFGPLLMRERSPAFRQKWARMLKQRLQTLAHFEQAQAVPEAKAALFAEQVRWIEQVLA